jgi:4a-hydroxytetrahydrobiopterin dehydratase
MAANEEKVTALTARRCAPCEGGTPPLGEDRVQRLLASLPDWERDGAAIARSFTFKGYGQTMAFVGAVSWVSQREGHHPDLEVGYNRCRVRYTTHAIGGLSENDFICAAKLDLLFGL